MLLKAAPINFSKRVEFIKFHGIFCVQMLKFVICVESTVNETVRIVRRYLLLVSDIDWLPYYFVIFSCVTFPSNSINQEIPIFANYK